MASFPTSVKSFGSRANGQTIDASHINDLQDEVNAIEDGYRNATAPLNSSGSTLATLNVTGGSTLASLDVNGNSTLASSITFGTIPYVLPSSGGSTGHVLTCVSTSGSTMGLEWRASVTTTPDAVRAQLEAVQELASGSSVGVSWTTRAFITNSSMHSTATNPDRLTPQTSGVYAIQVNINQRTGAALTIEIKDSSGSVIGGLESTNQRQFVGAVKYFDAVGGYVRTMVKPTASTSSLSTSGMNFMSLVKL